MTKLTRVHFLAFAAEIRKLPTQAERTLVYTTMLPVLLATNPNFDAARFREAAGVEG